MLDCQAFYEVLQSRGVDFYAGVPDSLLKDFCAYVMDHTPPERNVITANEGSAVALATGYFLATGKPGLVYMQNSGLGNAVNPLTSLADVKVYGVPVLLIIGWRGEPGEKDEPQHVTMGAVTTAVLDAIGVPWEVLPEEPAEAEAAVERALASMSARSAPYALVVRAKTFGSYKLKHKTTSPYAMTREAAIRAVIERLPGDALIVSTTGKPSREVFEVRVQRGESHERDFLTVGSMGHSSQIALGLATQHPSRAVVCLDGDGAVLMHMGGLATIGTSGAANYKHIVVNNGAHDSVGGQPTCAFGIDIAKVALACGYKAAWSVSSEEEIAAVWDAFAASPGPALLEVRVAVGARDDLGRPKQSPADLKVAFMGAVKAGA